MKKLIIVLLGAVFILILGLFAVLLTSCGVALAPENAISHPTLHATVILSDGSEEHPWRMQDSDGSSPTIWHVASGTDATPRQKWHVDTWIVTNNTIIPLVHKGFMVIYNDSVYQVISIDVVHHFLYTYQE